ncbi:MAG: preprotein translocase subunit YajC [Chromatiales bacterium]|nr:preprotein translocase subunit YajC [Chromatiales bacterium]
MSFFIQDAMAQAAGAAGQQPSLIEALAFPVLLIVVFYFLLIRPQQKKAKEHTAMVQALAKGDEVVTGGGLLGRVVEVSDDYISVEVAEGVVVRAQRATIGATLPKGTLKSVNK